MTTICTISEGNLTSLRLDLFTEIGTFSLLSRDTVLDVVVSNSLLSWYCLFRWFSFGFWWSWTHVKYVLPSVLQLRHVMDPKRHFKRSGKSKALPKYFQVSNLINRLYSEILFAQCVLKYYASSLVADVLDGHPTKCFALMLDLGRYNYWACIWVLLK